MSTDPSVIEQADRLERLLDLALSYLRDDGDEEAALLALQEATKAAEALPKRTTP
jgi:hypothetical protein